MADKPKRPQDLIVSPCGCDLTAEQVRTVWGRYTASLGGGRPRQAERCACGAMTRERARQRGHVCHRPKHYKLVIINAQGTSEESEYLTKAAVRRGIREWNDVRSLTARVWTSDGHQLYDGPALRF